MRRCSIQKQIKGDGKVKTEGISIKQRYNINRIMGV